MRHMKDARYQHFLKKLWKFHEENRRDLPWRNTTNPYRILVSEMMLQQTQVTRVLEKYKEFLKHFPTLEKLNQASMEQVLSVWKGLGYNRRAFFLKRIAKEIVENFKGKFPHDYTSLTALPGIGQSTAGALSALAFSKKVPFIETNIRAVILHDFFILSSSVNDKEIKATLESILVYVDEKDIREFYFALYDYGTHLKETLGKGKTELHTRSKHYKKQSTFEGSDRQLRSIILDLILKNKNISGKEIERKVIHAIETKGLSFSIDEKLRSKIQALIMNLYKEQHIEPRDKDLVKENGKKDIDSLDIQWRIAFV